MPDNVVTRIRTATIALLLALAAAGPLSAQVPWEPAAPGFPRTAAEYSGFTVYTRHLEMWDYLRALRAATTEMRLGSYGQTREGRELPYAIFSRPLVSEPWEAWELGRPIVVLAANVHGGERTFREGLMILMRDLATPGTRANALLDDVTIIVAPQINPDGFEASEQGQRGNSWGIDLNRDYVKLEQPSIANFVENIIAPWRPHLVVDGHNGGSRPYNLVYQCSSHYDTDPELTRICDDEIFPEIDAALGEEGYRSWYYQQGDEEEWDVGGFQARIGRNYVGFMNSIGMLFEAPAQGMEEGARAGYIGYLTVVEFVAEHAREVMGLVERANAETIAMGAEPRGEIAVTMEYGAEDEPADYLLVRGGTRTTPPDTIRVRGARLMKKPVATRLRPRPWAYLLPRDAEDAVAMLLRHGITVERLDATTTLTVDAYTVDGVTYEQAYNHAAAMRVQVGRVVRDEMEFPAGTYVVPTAQYLGRLVAHMLEPETDDNVVYWNTMDAWIPRDPGGVVPIYKLMRPAAFDASIVPR
jgi:dipeptidyl-peptidase-4